MSQPKSINPTNPERIPIPDLVNKSDKSDTTCECGQSSNQVFAGKRIIGLQT